MPLCGSRPHSTIAREDAVSMSLASCSNRQEAASSFGPQGTPYIFELFTYVPL
jgi:hypothetical protein